MSRELEMDDIGSDSEAEFQYSDNERELITPLPDSEPEVEVNVSDRIIHSDVDSNLDESDLYAFDLLKEDAANEEKEDLLREAEAEAARNASQEAPESQEDMEDRLLRQAEIEIARQDDQVEEAFQTTVRTANDKFTTQINEYITWLQSDPRNHTWPARKMNKNEKNCFRQRIKNYALDPNTKILHHSVIKLVMSC
jgi:hypothetical protein